MGLLDAFLSQPEQRLMGLVLTRPDDDFGTVELLQRMGNSRSAGSAVLQRWVASGILKEKKVGNQRRLSANTEFLLYPEMHRMALKTVGLVQPLAHRLAPFAEKLIEAFVFGSVAAGTDRSHSDIDIALVGEVDFFKLSAELDAAQTELGRTVHASVYSEQEWAANDPVIASIRNGPRLELMEAIRAEAR